MMMQHEKSRAFISMDAILAIALLTVLATGLLLSIAYARRGSGELAAHRSALSRAESVLIAIQDSSGAAIPRDVSVKELPMPAPQGFKWVQVRAEHRGKAAALTGLVRHNPVPANAGARP